MSIVLVGSTSGSVTLQEPAVAGSTILDLPAASGTVMVSGNQPAFSVSKSAAQTVTSGVFTTITYDVKEFDTNNNFASNRFTPTVAGYYQINAAYQISGAAPGFLLIAKNGSDGTAGSKRGAWLSNANFQDMHVSVLVYCNGTTDYIEIFMYHTLGSAVTPQGNSQGSISWFDGTLIKAA
jgi:hypothetical protein